MKKVAYDIKLDSSPEQNIVKIVEKPNIQTAIKAHVGLRFLNLFNITPGSTVIAKIKPTIKKETIIIIVFAIVSTDRYVNVYPLLITVITKSNTDREMLTIFFLLILVNDLNLFKSDKPNVMK